MDLSFSTKPALSSNRTFNDCVTDKLNILNDKVKEVAQAEVEVRKQVAELKPSLVPFSEMQAALANPVSRDKYFSHLSKNDFVKHVRDSLK